MNLRDVVVAYLADIPDEAEVLFDISTTFLVKDVTYQDDIACWLCVLEVTEDRAHLARDHVNFYVNEMDGTSSDVRFVGLLIDMCKFREAEIYGQKLLFAEDRSDIAHIHF